MLLTVADSERASSPCEWCIRLVCLLCLSLTSIHAAAAAATAAAAAAAVYFSSELGTWRQPPTYCSAHCFNSAGLTLGGGSWCTGGNGAPSLPSLSSFPFPPLPFLLLSLPFPSPVFPLPCLPLSSSSLLFLTTQQSNKEFSQRTQCCWLRCPTGRRCGRNLWAKLDTAINLLSANHA